jgi:hypothetical protein
VRRLRPASFLTDNEISVLKSIAENPDFTMHKIGRRLKLNSSSVLFLVKQLESRNLIRLTRGEEWRKTGHFQRALALTFIGSLCYLARLDKRKRVTEALEFLGDSLPYPPFADFRGINMALEEHGTETYIAIAQLVIDYPPYADWNSVTFKQPYPRKAWKLWEKRAGESKARQERSWMDQFAMHLLSDLRTAYPPVASPKLNSYYTALLQDRIRRKQKELENDTTEFQRLNSVIRMRERSVT